jgi:alpha-beta hydrolase superfamily lysophospholipase
LAKNSFFLQSEDGLSLEGRRWRPDHAEAEAILVIIHGLGEHIRRYHHLAEALNKRGVAVVGMDLRGHGRSDGPRGHAKSWSFIRDDIKSLLQHTRNIYPDLPLFLMGHSMGGLFALRYVNECAGDIQGLILSSPLLGLAFTPPAWQIKMAGWVSKFLPGFTQSNGLNPDLLSHDKQVVADYKHDPHVHNRISVGLFQIIQESMAIVNATIETLPVPVLAYHGTEDGITSFHTTRQFASQFPDKVTFEALEGFYHEPHNEKEAHKALLLLFKFINTTSKTKLNRTDIIE